MDSYASKSEYSRWRKRRNWTASIQRSFALVETPEFREIRVHRHEIKKRVHLKPTASFTSTKVMEMMLAVRPPNSVYSATSPKIPPSLMSHRCLPFFMTCARPPQASYTHASRSCTFFCTQSAPVGAKKPGRRESEPLSFNHH